MAWELTIAHTKGHRLGSPNEVVAALAAVWPDLEWIVNPPLLEQIQDDPEHPVHRQLPTWSFEQRRRAARPTTVGVLEGEALSFEITGIDDDPVEELYLDVRASTDPSPLLMQLKTRNGWTLKEMATDRRLQDEAQIRERWENFRRLFEPSNP